ncbi:tRNA-m1A22 methylase [Desulfocucumis palustris]|uniref:tRNA-m1A22 methylase n=1 Tax=Desulfocucumis palustris TaxID=1898651 RepID=A0A2L2XAM4_9FIRM|nr:class I SAM-dependent methyltransferase [Desulfocucumis palustris]GBF33024.1 tRNA-m1A22 methylase [Desulfocucumis palustris]
MELTRRLAAIAEFIPPGLVVADIGTDHARLPMNLVLSGRNPRVIATDLNEKPYRGAYSAVAGKNLTGAVDVRLGDGLRALSPGEAQVIVIAGMGGNTIVKILEDSRGVLAQARRMVLQPMADAGDLRLWLAGNGWKLVAEKLVVEDGRIYPVIVAEPGVETETDMFNLEIGPKLLENGEPLLEAYLEKIKADYQKILSGLARSRSRDSREKAIMLTSKLTRVRELLCRCRQNVK